MGTVAAGVAKANADHVDDRRPRRRHRRLAAGLDPARRDPLGDRPGRDPADAARATTCARASWSRPTARCAPAATSSSRALLGADEFGFSTAPLIAHGLHHDARLPPQHLPGRASRPRTRSCASASRASPSTSSTTCSWSPRRCAGSWRALGVRTIDELIGRTDLLEADGAIDHWKARGVDLTPLLAVARASRRDAPRRRVRAPDPVLDDALDWELHRARRGPRSSSGAPVALRARRRATSNRAVGGLLSSEIAARHGADGLPDGHDRGRASAARPARASAPGWRPGVELDARRRRQRLRRQGPVGRRRSPCGRRRGATLRRRGQRDRRQHRALRRDRRARVLPRPGRRALRGAQLGRARGGRGRRRPRLRVHDRRPRRRARPDRAATSPRA